MDTEKDTTATAAEPPEETRTGKTKSRRTGILVAGVVVVALVTMGITALLVNILNRMNEAADPYTKVVELDETVVDPAEWGKNFPLQYESYLQTEEMGSSPSGHGGSKPTTPENPNDPREQVATSRLEEDPRLVVMWDGYAFAKGYSHARGHAYMLEDQRHTIRVTDFDQPGTCLNCHASTVQLMDELGDGDRDAGFAAMNQMPYNEVTQLVDHPVSCIDCHDPETMELRVTRPAFERGIANYMEHSEGIEDYDVNRDATHQEMRTFVCGQCHVEYYFAGEEKELTFPWANGMEVDDIYQTTKDNGHVDFIHERTGAEITKAQHPEFDIYWSNSVHAENGVSCADCHMPYTRDGSRKVTDHHIGSPLFDVNASCLTCHTATEEEMIDRVVGIQDEFLQTRDVAFDSLVTLIDMLEAAVNDGTADEAAIQAAREYQDKASFYLDYVYSENSYGFHAPSYIQRILADSLDASRKGQLVLQGVDPATFEPSDVTLGNRETAESRER